jgi:hypothetical protein
MSTDKTQKNTPETVGNQFGYLCPKCNRGDSLSVAATVWVGLLPDGTDADNSDHEWDDKDGAACSACNWDGKVSDLKHAENFEGE